LNTGKFVHAYEDVLERRQKVRFEAIQQTKDLTLIANGRGQPRLASAGARSGCLSHGELGESTDAISQTGVV